ncbi:MAG: peptidoglycan bridge formation glycyltransferase FemA/FemB family protein [Clostridia bacterium]|nr:peptidoglycan bridge formation glycyltransferase FemA/FemB family protein [Clostridia bacterium]
MKTEIISLENTSEFDAFVAKSRNGHFMQSSYWGRVKDDWDWFGVICRNDSGEITGTAAVLVRKLAKLPYRMLYAPRGPVCDPGDKETFDTLISAIKKEGKRYNGYELKLDNDVDTNDESYRKIVTEAGFDITPVGDKITGLQCNRVIRINLEGKTEDEVFASFDSGHRRKVRVAIKNNVEIEVAGSEKAELFYDMMKETTERDGFALRSKEYFAKILDVFGDKARLYIAYYTPEDGERTAIAGALSLVYGDKLWYFYGASRNVYRNVMPNYLVQWEMIKWAVECGCNIYDFRGVDRFDEDDGLYRFKIKFGSYQEEFMGEMTLTLNSAAAKIIEAAQKLLGR